MIEEVFEYNDEWILANYDRALANRLIRAFVSTGNPEDCDLFGDQIERLVGDGSDDVYIALDALILQGIVGTGEGRMDSIEYWNIPGTGERNWFLTSDWYTKAQKEGYMKHMPHHVEISFGLGTGNVKPMYYALGGGEMTKRESVEVLKRCREMLDLHIEDAMEYTEEEMEGDDTRGTGLPF